jgi:hypothetical protein
MNQFYVSSLKSFVFFILHSKCFDSTEWLRKVVTFLHIAKRYRCFYKKYEDQKIYLIKWQHRIQYFVQLSLFLITADVTANLKF